MGDCTNGGKAGKTSNPSLQVVASLLHTTPLLKVKLLIASLKDYNSSSKALANS